jgi:hypothetical protein
MLHGQRNKAASAGAFHQFPATLVRVDNHQNGDAITVVAVRVHA